MKKKQFTTALLLAAALGLTACASTGEAAAADEALPVLKIGTAIDKPFFYMGESGEYTGIDREIAVEACRRMGYKPEFVLFTWGEQNDLLASGAIDCVWECFAMNGREDMYQWAGPYMTDEETIVVAADSDIYTLDDLAGKTISVRIGSKGEDYFLKESGSTILSDPQTMLCTFDTASDSFSYFGKGYADAVTDHYLSLQSFVEQSPQLYRFLDEPLMQLDLGVAFSKGYDVEVVSTLNATLSEMKADGTIASIAAAYSADAGKVGAADGT